MERCRKAGSFWAVSGGAWRYCQAPPVSPDAVSHKKSWVYKSPEIYYNMKGLKGILYPFLIFVIVFERTFRWSNSFYYIGAVHSWCICRRHTIPSIRIWKAGRPESVISYCAIRTFLLQSSSHGWRASPFCGRVIMIAHCQVRNKKIIADSGILVLDAFFSTLFRVSVRLQLRKTAVLSLLFPYGLVPILMPLTKRTRLPTPIF